MSPGARALPISCRVPHANGVSKGAPARNESLRESNMSHNTRKALVASGLLALSSGQALAVWTSSTLTSGIAGDAGSYQFGQWLDVDGDRAVVSDDEYGAFVYEASGSNWVRTNLSTGYVGARAVAIEGDDAFV